MHKGGIMIVVGCMGARCDPRVNIPMILLIVTLGNCNPGSPKYTLNRNQLGYHITLVNVYVDLVVFTRIAGTS